MSTITTKDGTEIFYKDWGGGQPLVSHHGLAVDKRRLGRPDDVLPPRRLSRDLARSPRARAA